MLWFTIKSNNIEIIFLCREGCKIHMLKICKCGSEMEITLRTLYFNKKIEIKNVPVYSCSSCSANELMQQVKPKVRTIIKDAVKKSKKQTLYLDKYSELVQLITMLYNEQDHPYKGKSIHGEVEELLEAFLIEDSLEEKHLDEQIHQKIEKMVH